MKAQVKYLIAFTLILASGAAFTYAITPIYEREQLLKQTSQLVKQNKLEPATNLLLKYANQHTPQKRNEKAFTDTLVPSLTIPLLFELNYRANANNNPQLAQKYLEQLKTYAGKWWNLSLESSRSILSVGYLSQIPNIQSTLDDKTFKYLNTMVGISMCYQRPQDPYNMENHLKHLNYLLNNPNGKKPHTTWVKRYTRTILELNKQRYLDPLTQLTPEQLKRIQTLHDHYTHELEPAIKNN